MPLDKETLSKYRLEQAKEDFIETHYENDNFKILNFTFDLLNVI